MNSLPTIESAELDDLFLDAKNPRLGRHNVEKGLSQDDVLDLMKDWSLDELAVSFLESGFWPQEALIAVREPIRIKGKPTLIVVEGNRRLAALKMIRRTNDGQETSSKWKGILKGYSKAAISRLDRIPYILKPNRESVTAYLGFRHVTGIKEWDPAEKAQFIAHLIEHEKLSYEEVRRRIGSKTPAVRQNYISYRLLLQMENESQSGEVDIEKVEKRFSVLYLSLRTVGVQQYLDIDIEADEQTAKTPIRKDKLDQLVHFARWLFGKGDQDAVISDSRQVDEFGRILESEAAVQYLERNSSPSFEVARRMAGVAESEVAEHVERAADETEEALKAAHQHKSSKRLQHAVRRLGGDALQLLDVFPSIRKDLLAEER
ncbi:MAG: hypothetical protein AABP62_22055 [Planctomycetota bacterium]